MSYEAIAAETFIRILQREGAIGSDLAEIVIASLRRCARKSDFSDKMKKGENHESGRDP